MRAFARRDHLDLPALLGGVALVHAEQVAGEQRGLVAAGAGADFEDDVALVHRILGQQRELDLLLQRGALLLQRRLLGLRHRAHLGVGLGIGDAAPRGRRSRRRRRDRPSRSSTTGLSSANSRDSFTKVSGASWLRQLGFDAGVAGEQRVEFLFGQHVVLSDAAAPSRPRRRPRAARGSATLPGRAVDQRDAASLPALPASSSSSIALTGPTAEGDSDSER